MRHVGLSDDGADIVDDGRDSGVDGGTSVYCETGHTQAEMVAQIADMRSRQRSDEATVISTPDQIAHARLLTLKYALMLEISGMKRRGQSVYAICRAEFGMRGSKARVLAQLEQRIREVSN